MSVNMDVGVSVPAGHFGAAGLEAEPNAILLDWVRGLMPGVAAMLGVLASCSLAVLVFLT